LVTSWFCLSLSGSAIRQFTRMFQQISCGVLRYLLLVDSLTFSHSQNDHYRQGLIALTTLVSGWKVPGLNEEWGKNDHVSGDITVAVNLA